MPKHSRLTWSATTTQRLPPILFACLLKSLSLVWHGLCWSRRPRNDNFIGTAIIYGRPIPPTLLCLSSPVAFRPIISASRRPREGCFALLGVEMIAISIFPFNVSVSESRVPGTQRLEMAIPCSPIYFAWRPRVNPIAICDLLSSHLTHKSTRAHHRELTGRWCR